MRAADDASCDSDLNEAKTQNPVSRLQLRLKAQVRHSHSQPASKFGRGSVPSRGALESQIPNVAFQEIRVYRRSALNVMRVQPQRSRGSCVRAGDTQMDKIRALAFGKARSKERAAARRSAAAAAPLPCFCHTHFPQLLVAQDRARRKRSCLRNRSSRGPREPLPLRDRGTPP